MHYFIGIDIGTTHTKAVLCTETARVLFETKKAYPSFQPAEGCHEQDPDEILAAVLEVLQACLETITDKNELINICFSAAMHSIMAVDDRGKPLTRLLTWADIRSNGIAKQITASADATVIYQDTGTPIHPMSPLCKLGWIRKELPAIFHQAYKFISCKEYVWQKLTGEWVIDHSIASATGLFNIHTKKWSSVALAAAGVNAEQLSSPVPIAHTAKLIHPLIADLLGERARLVIGASDGFLANLGSGAVLPAEMALTIGTSGAVRVIKSKPITDVQQRLFNYVADDNHFLCGGAINNGGIALKWFQDSFLQHDITVDSGLDGWMERAAAVPAGAEGLIFLPYLYGERAPVWDAAAKAIFFGIRPQHTTAHFLRAVLEGVAFSLLQIMEAMEENDELIETVFASGGFIASPLWLQIVTDVLQKKMKVSHAADASAMGAIYLGFLSSGKIQRWEDVKAFIHVDEELLPNPAPASDYRENYKIYKALYQSLKPFFT